jgi:hypothetical protein
MCSLSNSVSHAQRIFRKIISINIAGAIKNY